MKTEKLTDIKKDLSQKNVQQLTEICLRLSKYKKENKELLNYLLFDAHDPLAYAEKVKSFLEEDFKTMQKHYYYSLKALRKILRVIKKHAKYTASKQAELELLLWFCNNYLEYIDPRTSHQPLRNIFTRQVEAIQKIFPKLHEDLQFDYNEEYSQLLQKADERLKWFSKSAFQGN